MPEVAKALNQSKERAVRHILHLLYDTYCTCCTLCFPFQFQLYFTRPVTDVGLQLTLSNISNSEQTLCSKLASSI